MSSSASASRASRTGSRRSGAAAPAPAPVPPERSERSAPARSERVPDVELAEIRTGIGRLQRLFASRRVHSGMASAAGVHLSQQALQVLRTLAETPARPVSDLARAARMDTGAVSRQLRVLEDEGLVHRRASPAHGSIVLVEATEEGLRLARRYEKVRSGQLGRALAHWTPEERAQLGHLLVRLVDDLQSTPYLDPDDD